jgi:agmatine deiminase
MVRFPAEWEEQDTVQLTWPHKNSDWRSLIKQVETTFITIANEISNRQKLIIVCQNPKHLKSKLKKLSLNVSNISFAQIDSNDTWARDHGGITVYENNRPKIIDFVFNGWGMKFAADKDNLITKKLHSLGYFGSSKIQSSGMVFEGGAIESDGNGTLLTTTECLMSPNRNPAMNKLQIEKELSKLLGARKILWLNHGALAGDDTDSHIDTLARICPNNTIVYQSCDDTSDAHFDELKMMEDELTTFTNAEDEHFRLLPLPWPSAKFAGDSHRLPATYANYLIINGAVLVPTYNNENDTKALDVIKTAFPDREIIGIDCSLLIEQHGSLHCVTMQYPKGVL